MQGIERSRESGGPHRTQGGLLRIVIRYEDGREMRFVPDAGRSSFSEDDILELKKLFSKASATAEWADINTRLGF